MNLYRKKTDSVIKKSCEASRSLKIRIEPLVYETIMQACEKAGLREIGGMLFAQHVSPNTFRVLEATVEAPGTISRFVRGRKYSLKRLQRFFAQHDYKYTEYNYLGEWHSHPSFGLEPSTVDDETIMDFVTDHKVGANFAVLLIVKIQNGQLTGNIWAYFPSGERTPCILDFAEPDK